MDSGNLEVKIVKSSNHGNKDVKICGNLFGGKYFESGGGLIHPHINYYPMNQEYIFVSYYFLHLISSLFHM